MVPDFPRSSGDNSYDRFAPANPAAWQKDFARRSIPNQWQVRAIFLLHPSLVILSIGTATRALDPDLLAIIPNGLSFMNTLSLSESSLSRTLSAMRVITGSSLTPP
jgi:hypothetical protein